ncbi:YdeI family protein [uncultured Chitinophaga sp.]|uniref:YdeI/OmpD-associated family protein n=1 Tax=uncultured Chitinophaga sp. TaxID=339340 RepID=UPI0025DE4186|nr:YdeI/OmpD-associated family protein [uncultured Chitinophaga sp.]
MNPEVDNYFDKLDKWGKELEKLRTILLDCGLTEDLKWGSPCYSYEGSNVSIIGGLRDYCVLSFFKGVLLHDEHNLLEKPGDNTRSARVIPITSVKQITSLTPVLKAYIYEAIEIERAGLKVDFEASNELAYPEELTLKLAKNPKLKAAFAALTPGRQRGYILHFAAAKQPKTREARIDKFTPKILEGKGMNDY